MANSKQQQPNSQFASEPYIPILPVPLTLTIYTKPLFHSDYWALGVGVEDISLETGFDNLHFHWMLREVSGKDFTYLWVQGQIFRV